MSLEARGTECEPVAVTLARGNSREQFGLEFVDRGGALFVNAVKPHSLADIQGGLHAGDRVVSINGRPATTKETAQKLLQNEWQAQLVVVSQMASNNSSKLNVSKGGKGEGAVEKGGGAPRSTERLEKVLFPNKLHIGEIPPSFSGVFPLSFQSSIQEHLSHVAIDASLHNATSTLCGVEQLEKDVALLGALVRARTHQESELAAAYEKRHRSMYNMLFGGGIENCAAPQKKTRKE